MVWIDITYNSSKRARYESGVVVEPLLGLLLYTAGRPSLSTLQPPPAEDVRRHHNNRRHSPHLHSLTIAAAANITYLQSLLFLIEKTQLRVGDKKEQKQWRHFVTLCNLNPSQLSSSLLSD